MQMTISELLHSKFIEAQRGQTILAFQGVVSQESIVGMGEAIRSELFNYSPVNIVNKVFAIYIEMTQNILHYSYQKANHNGKQVGQGSFFLIKHEKGYNLVTVNLISTRQKSLLEQKCELVNSLNKEELKKLYMEQRYKEADTDSKGAGLGFIDMVRRSGAPVGYYFEPVHDGNYVFFLSSNVETE